MQPTNTVPAGVSYPVARPGLARAGLDVYRANGCAYCHSQRVTQTGTVCDVALTDAGTNRTAVLAVLRQLRPSLSESAAAELLGSLPKPVLSGVTKGVAEAAVKAMNTNGAKSALAIVPVGPDIARGWGKRRTVAEDFLYDFPVMPGAQRTGPDLSNVGVRQPDVNWHLLHLYAPQAQVKSSTMPAYRFLFEKRRVEKRPSPDALVLPAGVPLDPGYEIVPTSDAKALAAYLVSLRADAPLFIAPVTLAAAVAPAIATNAPPDATNSVPANAPAK
jgi:ribosomal protein L7/L12